MFPEQSIPTPQLDLYLGRDFWQSFAGMSLRRHIVVDAQSFLAATLSVGLCLPEYCCYPRTSCKQFARQEGATASHWLHGGEHDMECLKLTLIGRSVVLRHALVLLVVCAGMATHAEVATPTQNSSVQGGGRHLDDSDLNEAEIVDRLAPPARIEDLELDGGTRGFAAVAAPRVSLQSVTFSFDSARLTGEAVSILDTLASALNSSRLAAHRFQIEGHTDAIGDGPYNARLSQLRAQAVCAYLAKKGVSADRLIAVGKGESELLEGVSSDAAAHRRVEVVRVDRQETDSVQG